MNSAWALDRHKRGQLFTRYATLIRFRRAPKLPRGLLQSINSILLLLPLFFYGHDVKADAELAYFVQYGYYKQEGLYPIEVWQPGTGYASYEEAIGSLVPALLQRPGQCVNQTFNFSGVTCTLTYIGTPTFNAGVFNLYVPPNSEVKFASSFSVSLPLLMTCTNGYQGITADYCGGAIIAKQRDQQCPIAPLQPLSDDPCTQSLEAGRGVDVYGACASGLSPEMQQEAQCLANKITSLGISYPGPTSTIRTGAYQAHLREIWEKAIELDGLDDPAVIQACASRKTEIEGHKISHGLTNEPTASSSRHGTGEAVDVGNDVVRELSNRVTTDMSDLQEYVNSQISNPPACNLRWGGRFRQYDPVHFQLP